MDTLAIPYAAPADPWDYPAAEENLTEQLKADIELIRSVISDMEAIQARYHAAWEKRRLTEAALDRLRIAIEHGAPEEDN
jgi:hypothetical protein